ncbi:probable methyltransferase TARBP1 [Periophthalmus magnuspinnatus]|uniref:probable methyltransferase TARBP1 n=1 Tax=Periophthalmus magnuspinnatus TaxID=409849 RepID=UPI0024372E87|nr:probable methyltransferase TARBP1 [Periophthalmus magnuspinnatus]
MSSFLIETLLSSCQDYELLFKTLSWESDSWPQTGRAEALTAFIEGLGSLSSNSDVNSSIAVNVDNVIWSQCVPLLSKISSEIGENVQCKESLAVVCKLIKACIPLCDAPTPGKVTEYVLPFLHPSEEDLASGRISVDVASEVLAVLLPTITPCSNEELALKVLTHSLSCMKTLPDAQVSRVALRLISALLNCSSGTRLINIRKLILDDLCSWHGNVRTPAVTGRSLMCLAALSDHILTPNCLTSDPRLSIQFWRMVQDGLTHKDSLARKRALYLLKRCVALSQDTSLMWQASKEGEVLFMWDSNNSQVLREFWEDFALVMETLEENQIHVVRPVLNRIDTLIQIVNDTQGNSLLHPSWLLCVYQRMFHSENKALMKEGVCHLLQLQALQKPEFAMAFSQFVIGPFLDVLSETSLFQRAAGQRVGECPELGSKLQVFMINFFTILPSDQKASLLLQLIQHLATKQWCAVPVLFISQALSSLSPVPLLDVNGLIALREVLRCTMITHQVLLRGAAQCFLLNSALCLTDVSAVSLDDVFGLLMHFRSDESLSRGTKLWHQVCIWLMNNEHSFKPINYKDQEKESIKVYVQNEIHNYLKVPASTGQSERLPDVSEAAKLARAILLCADMEMCLPARDVNNSLESLLSPLWDTLSRVSTNIYLPLRKSDKSLQLMLQLLLQGGINQDDNVLVALKNQIFKVLDPILEFIVRQLCGQLQELFDIERADMYMCVLKQLVLICRSIPQHHSKIQNTYFPKLISCNLKILTEPSQENPSVSEQVSRVVAMASLALICSLVEQNVTDMQPVSGLKMLNEYFYSPLLLSPSCVGRINETLRKPSALDCLNDTDGYSPMRQDWGRVVANYLRDQWICLSLLSKTAGITATGDSQSTEILRSSVSCAVEGLSLLPNNLVLPIFAFFETALPQLVQDDESLCVDAISLSWDLVRGLSTNPLDFWPSLKCFISFAFHHKLLMLAEGQSPNLTATIKRIASELMELSQSKSGVFGLLIQHCCQLWLPSGQTNGSQDYSIFSSVFNHIEILIEACVYGPVFRRDQRLIQDVQSYVEQLGEECAANVLCGDGRDDQLPRACALSLLSRLAPSDLQHQRLMQSVVLELLKKDDLISSSKVRYYNNSMQHRVKNRIWQTLLVLLPKLNEDFVTTILSSVYQAGFCSNQASVKYLIEWLMILILSRYPEHINSFWECFNVDHEKTKVSICTFLSVLVHFNVILPNIRDQVVQLRKALDIILQCCFNHNFSVRLYALLALKRVWSLAEARAGDGGADGLHSLSSVIMACLNQAEVMQSTGNANKNWIKIQEHFFFGAFHPLRDYSLETILYTFPSLSDLSDDEWIHLWKFEKMPCFSHIPTCPLKNPASDLRELNPGDWIQQDKSEQDKEERWAEVQKKITPWKLDIQEQEPELQLIPHQRAARMGKTHGALLVVASLIDKPTNLGGLCRTCEIFGASALVLDSLRHVNDKQFQALSVTSERWLPLLEVKPLELTDFLQLKKSDGYCIVGVEQTANSHSLESYHFPKKTLLLLGNEREGIPANLLQMLDVCVEIPQQGVIRSLNVHVSAALLIWEYTRQHLISGAGKANTKVN